MASLSTLQDLFNQNTLDTGLWSQYTDGSATMSYSSAGAAVTFPATSSSSTDGDITSVSSYNMTGSGAYMGIVSVLSGSQNDCNLTIRKNANNYYQFQIEAGTIYAQYVVAGAQTNAWSTTFSLVTHKYIRIRESGGTSFWDTSTDGSTWTNRFSTANKITLTAVKVNIGGISWGSDASAGTFSWNNFNVLPSTTPTNLFFF